MNALRAHPAVAAAAAIAAWMSVPGIVSAQEYAKWYQQSERHFLELKQKAGGGPR
jgi:hypothetical protein